MDNFDGVRERFSGNSGPRNQSVNVIEILQTFLLFFTEDFVNTIVQRQILMRNNIFVGGFFHFDLQLGNGYQ